MVIAKALTSECYFLFRKDGSEIPFNIKNGKIKCLETLTFDEKSYISYKFDLKRKLITSHKLKPKQVSEVINMHLVGFTTQEIATHFAVKKHVIDLIIDKYWKE